MLRFFLLVSALLLAGCQDGSDTTVSPETAADVAASETSQPSAEARLAEVLAAQPEDVQARFRYRNPQETLSFFGIEPGMTVVEGLPGGGWYSKILLPYLGPEGHLVGVDYAKEMFPLFGFFTEERLAAKETWVEDWTAGAAAWYGDEAAKVSAFVFGSMPAEMAGAADAALMIRATHNLARFEGNGGYLTQATADLFNVLKPGGVLGIVQHWAPDEMPDSWADGSRGYLKRDFIIKVFEDAGFEFVASSPVNHNHRDQPSEEDVVWRLPPSLATSRENPALRAEMEAIGESNRMTLKFRKPAG